jgi:hypothetical protein
MPGALNLKEIERRAWRSFFADGLWDIYLGVLLALMGVNAWLGELGLPEAPTMLIYVALVAAAMGLLWAGKRFVTTPRIGRVKFGPQRRVRVRIVRVLLAESVALGIGLFVFFLAGGFGQVARIGLDNGVLIAAVWVLNVLIVFGLGAYFLDFARLLVIGLMFATAIPVDILVHRLWGLDVSPLAFGVPGLLVILMGLVLFVRFLRDYPLPEDVPDAG